MWDVVTGRCKRILYVHEDRVLLTVFNFDNSKIASLSEHREVRIWDIEIGYYSKIIDFVEYINVSFSHDLSKIALTTDNFEIKIYDLESDKIVKTLIEYNKFIESVLFNHDDSQIISCTSETIIICDVETGEIIRTLIIDNDINMSNVSLNHDSTLLDSGFYDGTIIIRSLKKGEIIKTLIFDVEYIGSFSFSYDSNLLITSGDNIKIWDLESCECIETLDEHCSKVNSAIFSNLDLSYILK